MPATTTKPKPESNQVGERVIAALEVMERTNLDKYTMDVFSIQHEYKVFIVKVK